MSEKQSWWTKFLIWSGCKEKPINFPEVSESTSDEYRDVEDAQPLVEIKSSQIDPVRGLVVELDWSPEFIQYLRERGYVGSEDEMVALWLERYARYVADRMNTSKEKTYG